jgi:hypothetical protein
MLDQPNPTPLPPLDMDSGLTAVKRPVGRPAISAEQRALSDQKYAQIMELMGELPVEAKEPRFHIYPARMRVDQKLSFRPLARALLSEFKDKNFKEPGTLSAYLLDRFGEGRYCIEAYDAHSHRLDKIPSWYVTAGEPSMLDDDDDRGELYDDEPEPRRRRSRRMRDDELDDPVENRANIADLLITNSRQASGQAAVAARSSSDMLGMLMFTQTSQNEARAQEERRREEARADERKREDQRAEERRREAQEERKREDDRAERERKDEREREERQRREDTEQRRRDDDKRQADFRASMDAANRKTELLIGALTTMAPILGKVFEKRETSMEIALTRSLTEKKEADPVMMMLMKSILDKSDRKDGTEMMVQQMIEFSKVSSQMTAEQMRGAMAMSNDMNREMLKRAMAMMESTPQGQTPEGKNFLTQMMEALAGAGDFAKAIFPVQPAAPVIVQQAPPQQQRRALPHQRQQQPQQPQQPQPAQPAQAAQPQQPHQLTPEQQAQADAAPRGVTGVLAALMAIHGHQYQTQDQYQALNAYLLQEMPVDLRVAIIEGQEATVFQIVRPFYEASPELNAWITKPDVLLWIREYVPKLSPHILAMHGSHDEQRAQLAGLLAQQAAEDEAARAVAEAQGAVPAPVQPPPQPGNVVQPPPEPGNQVQPPAEQPPAQGPAAEGSESDLAITPDGGGAPTEPGLPVDQVLPANPQLMQGAVVGGAVAVPVGAAAKTSSHLDPDEP